MRQYVHDRIKFKEGKIEGRAEEKADNIGKTINILRDLSIGEDIIAEKVEEEFKISNEEVQQFL